MSLLLVAVGAAAYANSLWGVFLFDDAYAIVDNLRIRGLFPIERWLATERPVVELSLALNYAMGKLNVVGYHVVNVAVHVAAALTLFGLVRRTIELNAECGVRNAERTTAEPTHSQFRIHNSAFVFAFVVALIWLIHPLQTESVTYVIQRAESLMGLLYLLTLYLFVRGATSARSWPWQVAAVLVCASGMASKAVIVTAPVMVLMYDRFFIAGSFRKAWERRWSMYLGLVATWGMLFACGILQHVFAPTTDRTAIGFGFKGISSWQYALTQAGVVWHYLRLSLWPHPLCLDYAWPVARGVGEIILPLAGIVGLLWLTLWGCIRRHWLGFVGIWFFVILAPTSSVIPIRDVAVEHRMYLPLAAVIVVMAAVARAGWNIMGRKTLRSDILRRWIEVAAVGGIVALLGSCTVRRNRDYHDDLSMWKEVAQQRPDNARAHVNIGVLLEQRGEAEEAVKEYRIALGLEPDYADAHYNLGVALIRLNRVAEAERAFRDAIRLSSGDAPAHVNLATLLYRRSDWDAASAEYGEAVRLAPYDQGARLGLARTLVKKAKLDEAIAEFRRLLEIAPNSAVAHFDLANAYIRKGDFPPAIEEFREAARLEPTDVVSRINLGTALSMEGRADEAVAWFRDVLRIDPDQADAHFNLADTLIEQGKVDEGIDEYRQVLRTRPSDAGVYVAIGRALLRAERLDEAIAQFRQALALDPNHAEAKKALEYALSMQNR
jgi:tetratricopeptide (TPR) repeat protein